jgi:hypothetical protein
MSDFNPRAVIGDNNPESLAIVEDMLRRLHGDYEALKESAASLIASGMQLDFEISNELELTGISNVIVAMRDTMSRAEAHRVAEKQPYLRGGQAVDEFFNKIKDDITKIGIPLKKRVDAWQNKKLVEERERRRLEAERLAREEAARRAEEERLRREAEDKRLAADRARTESTRAAKEGLASVAEQEAAAAAAAASTASLNAEAARIETLRPAADLTRTRLDGRMVTTREVGYAEIVNADELDPVALWPFVNVAAKAAALRAWAKANGHARQMAGASIGKRDEAVVR